MVKSVINVGIIGLGTVGSGVAQILKSNQEQIASRVGSKIEIKSILEKPGYQPKVAIDKNLMIYDADAFFNDPEIDIVVELIGGLNPANDFILRAMKAGKHVVTANKELIAKNGQEILQMASACQVDFMFEASTGGGIPIIRPLKQCLAANDIEEVMGIINGTTNYILSKMTQEGREFNEVLKEAQEKGYAEADPTSDIEGYDAAYKLAILASVAFNTRVKIDDIYFEGITKITPLDIEYANNLGYTIKLLAIAKEIDGKIELRVHPTMIPHEHPLSNVQDAFNAIFVKGNAVGDVMFYGAGAGSLPTGSAVVGDIIDIARNINYGCNTRVGCTCFMEKPVKSMGEVTSGYYIRFHVLDQPGVLATISGVFGQKNVSIYSVIQKGQGTSEVELVFVTQVVKEKDLQASLKEIEHLPQVKKIGNVIRVEGGKLK